MERIGLEGGWELVRISDGSRRPMEIPGDILSALLAAGEIPDPYYADNELDLQWIGREDWLLERDIALDSRFLAPSSIYLEALVLDTVAEIRVNGQLLGTSRNMFRRFRTEVKPWLKTGVNRISVMIRSPEAAAASEAAYLPYPMPASEYPVCSPHRNLLRKAQCMAGWDWGPCLMTGGIYDGISLVAHEGPRIEYATTRMRRDGQDWIVGVEVELDSPTRFEGQIRAELAGSRAELAVSLPVGVSRQSLELRVSGVREWWPAGQGEQPLYELGVEAVPEGSRDATQGGGGHSSVKRLGFRELKVLAKEDEWGKSLKFVVNGREIFLKGANWIPADALPSRWTKARLADLLGSAVAANMNTLRVWGGGRYESEDFYGLCDELGILIWQDCMFSCALYPSNPAFLEEVEAEMRHQVLRLKDHPCLALWCGNNELLGAITWYEASRANPARYIADYDRLTEGTVGRIVGLLDPDRAWWPSSPSAGPNDYSDNWHSDGRGDMHFWSVWHEGKPFSHYLTVRPRFCSEFGFQSLPSPRTVASFAPAGQRNVTAPMMEHHQRHPRGNTLIVETMLRYFRMPAGFAETLYLSQVQQALAIRTAVEFWRSLRPRCMGTLYWQLNDVWPVASWSSLEYDGNWKLLHHEARRFYEPVHLALILAGDRAEAYAFNDGQEALSSSLTLRLNRFDGTTVREEARETALAAASSTLLWSMPLAELPAKSSEIFLEGCLRTFPADSSPGATSSERKSRLFLTEPKHCELADPKLRISVEADKDGLALRLKAGAPAFWVALDMKEEEGCPRGRFADSGFDLGPGEERFIPFLPAPGSTVPTPAELEAAVRILHLRASYE